MGVQYVGHIAVEYDTLVIVGQLLEVGTGKELCFGQQLLHLWSVVELGELGGVKAVT